MLSASSSPSPYLEAHKFLLVEGRCRILAARESALNILHRREVYAPSWGGPAAGYSHRQPSNAKLGCSAAE